MKNRVHLRVQKKKPTKRNSRRKLLLKKVLDYLKSDTFMYAPLLSSDDFNSFASSPPQVPVVEMKKPVKENQRFGEQVKEYLISDVYMYDPLLHLPYSSQEPLQDCGMIRKDDSTRRLKMRVNQRTGHLGNTNQISDSHIPQTECSDQLTRGHTETVKHTVYQSCRSTSAPRIVTLNSQLRAHG